MALSSKSLNLIIQTLAKRLFEDENLMIRAKAAQSVDLPKGDFDGE